MKHNTIPLILLAIAITTGCSNSEQITVSNLTNTNEASIEASLESPTEDSDIDDTCVYIYAKDDDVLVGGCGFTEENKPKEYSIDEIECEPIDKTADCEAILLEKADRLYTLIRCYLDNGSGSMIGNAPKKRYKYNINIRYVKSLNSDKDYYGAKIISDEMENYSDFKSLFADSIYGDYFDYINWYSLAPLFEVNGVLYGYTTVSCFRGLDETWYLGYDVYDDRIVGHFAGLRDSNDPDTSDNTPGYLNDESHYNFYDITVQLVNGVYVITSCRETTSGYDYSTEHGICYNSGFADRSLITNERVAPKY